LTFVKKDAYAEIPDKAKPAARWGRKATGLMETTGLPGRGSSSFFIKWRKPKMKKLFLCLTFLAFLAGTVDQATPSTITINYDQGTPQAVSNIGGAAFLSDLNGMSVSAFGYQYVMPVGPTVSRTGTGTVQFVNNSLISDTYIPLGAMTGIEIGAKATGFNNATNTISSDATWSIQYLGSTGNWLDSVTFSSGSAAIAFNTAQFTIISGSSSIYNNPDIIITFQNQISLGGQLQDNLYSTLNFQFLGPGLRQNTFSFDVGTDVVSCVPIPSTVLLLGFGLLCLLGWRRFGKS
jgi:hypothetical protein